MPRPCVIFLASCSLDFHTGTALSKLTTSGMRCRWDNQVDGERVDGLRWPCRPPVCSPAFWSSGWPRWQPTRSGSILKNSKSLEQILAPKASPEGCICALSSSSRATPSQLTMALRCSYILKLWRSGFMWISHPSV